MPTQHQRIHEVFLAVVHHPTADRAAILDRECGDDESLRREVESLLKHHDTATLLPNTVVEPVNPAKQPSRTVAYSQPLERKTNRRRTRVTVSTIGSTVFSWLLGTPLKKAVASIVACVLLLGLGWYLLREIRVSVQQQLASKLTTVLDTEKQALEIWFALQKETAEAIARDDSINRLTRRLVEIDQHGSAPVSALLTSPEIKELAEEMIPLLESHDFEGFVVVSPGRRILAATDEVIVGNTSLAQKAVELEHVFVDEPRAAILLPFAASVPLPDADGTLRVGLPTMFVVAPVLDDRQQAVAAIGFRVRPDTEFTSILRIAQTGDTGETYAFNREGWLLTESRFDNQLREVGLISHEPHARSVLSVAVRDPGVDMTAGSRPTTPRGDQPLTRMAESATKGEDGIDLSGYRDYRGVMVIGAWRWLEEFDFGIATEIDVDEAYLPLRQLNWLFGILFGILAVAVAVSLRTAFSVVRLRQEVREARQVGPYRLQSMIGEGGMGQVFLAQHDLLKRPTAVKLLRPEQSSPQATTRFQREVQLASQLTHPNTVEVFDFGSTPDGSFYYAMEYLPGFSLDRLIPRGERLPVARVVHILRQVCRSLNEAHEKGMIHRDIKPQNIMLCERGGEFDFVKVLDFGLAKEVNAPKESQLTAEFSVNGTPLYIAPEALEGNEQVDARSDLYAIGIVGYELLTGKPPFEGRTIVELLSQTIHHEPPSVAEHARCEIPPILATLIDSCLAKSPAERPASTGAMADQMDEVAADCAWSRSQAREAWNADTHAGPSGGNS